MTATLTLNAPASVRPSAAPDQTVEGGVRWLLRLEGLVMLLGATAAYRALGGTWGLFAAWFFVPDLSLLGYLAGPRAGAAVYNAGHSLMGPALLALAAVTLGLTPAVAWAACVWVGHIGFDRAAGYGLKYQSSFFETHLGRVGRGR